MTHAAEAHPLMSNEPTTLLDRSKAFRLDSERLRSCHAVSNGFSHFTEFPHWEGVGYLLISYPFGIQDISSQPFGGPRAMIYEMCPPSREGAARERDHKNNTRYHPASRRTGVVDALVAML